jgi:hypothetical protein
VRTQSEIYLRKLNKYIKFFIKNKILKKLKLSSHGIFYILVDPRICMCNAFYISIRVYDYKWMERKRENVKTFFIPWTIFSALLEIRTYLKQISIITFSLVLNKSDNGLIQFLCGNNWHKSESRVTIKASHMAIIPR